MRLDERQWIVSAGLGAEWRWVHQRRADAALASVRRIASVYKKQAPAAVRARGYDAGLDAFLRERGPMRARLLQEPGLDYWLFLWDKHFGQPCDETNWHLQFGLFQTFAALALLEGRAERTLTAVLDPDAHLHLYGTRVHLAFPKERALEPVTLRAGKGALTVEGAGAKIRLSADEILRPRQAERKLGGAAVVAMPEAIPGVRLETCGLLSVQGVVMHGLAAPTPKELERFGAVLKTALEHVGERDRFLFDEMTDLVRVLVPLVNPKDMGSVSSSYVNMRGTICLSHAEDPLLQAETLIHEFCHQKMNQLLLADPLLLPGQGGQVFYSPWRPDARRLRGLILGAHAFLNVSRYLMRSLSREEYDLKARISVMCNVARRLYEVEQAVQTVCAYGDYTEFGRRFVLGLAREVNVLFHGAQSFPEKLMKEARLACEAHRKRHALPLTGLHRAAGFSTPEQALRFGQKRVVVRGKARQETAA